MNRLGRFVVKFFMVHYMGKRYVMTGEMPSARERELYL